MKYPAKNQGIHPIVTTERLVLRSLHGSDVQVLFAYRSLPEVYKTQGWQPSTLTDAANFIERHALREGNIRVGQWHQLGICFKEDGTLIGDCGFHLLSSAHAAIGYTLAPAHQKQGYAREAVNGLIRYLFQEIGLQRVYARTLPDNTPSVRLLEALDFTALSDAEKKARFPKAEPGERYYFLDAPE